MSAGFRPGVVSRTLPDFFGSPLPGSMALGAQSGELRNGRFRRHFFARQVEGAAVDVGAAAETLAAGVTLAIAVTLGLAVTVPVEAVVAGAEAASSLVLVAAISV